MKEMWAIVFSSWKDPFPYYWDWPYYSHLQLAGKLCMYPITANINENEPLEPLTVLDSPLLMQWDSNCISNSSSWWTSAPDGGNCLRLGRANLNLSQVPQNNLSSSHGNKREGTAADITQPKCSSGVAVHLPEPNRGGSHSPKCRSPGLSGDQERSVLNGHQSVIQPTLK